MTWSKEEQWQVLRWRKRKKGKRKQKKVKMRLTKGISQISIRLLLFVRHFCLLSRYINFHYYLKWQITSFLLYLLKEQFFFILVWEAALQLIHSVIGQLAPWWSYIMNIKSKTNFVWFTFNPISWTIFWQAFSYERFFDGHLTKTTITWIHI